MYRAEAVGGGFGWRRTVYRIAVRNRRQAWSQRHHFAERYRRQGERQKRAPIRILSEARAAINFSRINRRAGAASFRV
jgi:hypothetical protein